MSVVGRIGLAVWCLFLTADVFAVPSSQKWEEQKGQNFIIYYRDVPQDFVDTVMASAEEDFGTVTANLGISRYENWSWDKRAVIYIYHDEQDYVQNGGQADWTSGTAQVGSKVIKTYPSAQGFFDSTLPHELGHIIFHELVGQYADVPLWFEEGVAMYQEKAKRVGSDSAVRQAIEKGQFIPLTGLTDMRLYKDTDKNAVQLFYAEAASAVYFLITEFDEQHFHKFCLELKENTRFEDALRKIYVHIKGLEDLNVLWLRHLQGG
jgi:hypothetical protein